MNIKQPIDSSIQNISSGTCREKEENCIYGAAVRHSRENFKDNAE
jgi:hypothetical protein